MVGVVEEEVIVDEGLLGDDAQQVDDVAVSGKVKDGEVDVRVGVGGVEKAARQMESRTLQSLRMQ